MVAVSPMSTASARRIGFLIGSTKVSRRGSGNMEVRHVLLPSVTSTRSDPKPRRGLSFISRICSPTSAGSRTKAQPSVRRASHSHSSASKVNSISPASHSVRREIGTSPVAAWRPLAAARYAGRVPQLSCGVYGFRVYVLSARYCAQIFAIIHSRGGL